MKPNALPVALIVIRLDGYIMKKCRKCLRDIPVTEFNSSRDNKDGFQAWCKGCYSTYLKAYSASRSEAKAKHTVFSKTCKDCGLDKPVSQFGVKANNEDKRNIYCKPCWRTRCYKSMKRSA